MKYMKKIMAAVAASAVAVLSFASLTASADLKARDEAPYNAFLAIQAGGDSKWVSSTDDPAVVAQKNSITEATEATITGDGSYSVDVTMVNGSETIEAMILSTNINAYSFAKVEIDSIEVHHVGGGSTPLAYAGPSEGALRTADDGTSIRVNIMNVWTKPQVNDIGTGEHVSPDGGLAAGDKIVVNFTVSGISNGGNGEGTTAPSDNSGNNTTTTTAANGGNGTDGTTTAATNADGTPATTTAAGSNGGSSNGSNGGSSNSSSGGSSSSNNSKSGTNNVKTSQTGDFGIAAVALGAVATAALGVGAYTITRKKK